MKTLTMSAPRFGFVLATRAALAFGAGLLISRRLSNRRRRKLGNSLVALGVATTVPAAMLVTRARRASGR